MSVITGMSRVRDLVFDNDDISVPGSPSRLVPSGSSESYMYLSSPELTRSDFSRGIEESEDLSLDQIHVLLEKARHLKEEVKHDIVKSSTVTRPVNHTFAAANSSTPLQNLNFKPKLNLLEKHRAFQNSPLSQSTPLISQVGKPSHGIETSGSAKHILQRLNDENQTGLRNVTTLFSKVEPATTAPGPKEVVNNLGTVESETKNYEHYSKPVNKSYISPDPTPPTSSGNQEEEQEEEEADISSPSTGNNTGNDDSLDELMRLKTFLQASDVGKKLLESFERGIQTPPSTAPTRFSRSATSTPTALVHRSSSLASFEQRQDSELLSDRDEIDYLKSKLEDANAIIKDFDEQHMRLQAQISEKESIVSQLHSTLDSKETEAVELKQKLASQQDSQKVENFLNAIIGDENTAIDREFLQKNGCENLYDSLKLSEADGMTFIQLQNLIKEIAITLQSEVAQLEDVTFTIAKFFREDYLRLILFIEDMHRLLYNNDNVKLPEIYKLNWIANKDFKGLDDLLSTESFESCLGQMIVTVRSFNKMGHCA